MLLLSIVLLIPAVLSPLFRHNRLLRLGALAIAYLWIDLVLVVGAFWLWLRRPLPRQHDLAWKVQHAQLLGWALDTLMAAARRCLGYQVDASGMPELRQGETAQRPLLVLARHAGPGDSFTLVSLLIRRYGRLPRVVLKEALRWDPGLDVVLTRLACYFLPSRSGAGEDRVDAIAAIAADLGDHDALLLFPEGGNWTPRRHRRAVIGLLRAGHRRRARRAREMARVLPIRPGGAVACLSSRPDADVVVIAHTGLDTLVNPRQMAQAIPLRGRTMRIHGWLHRASTVPREESSALAWLDEQWSLVDAWIARSS